jgi:NADPH:quinone reductase
MRFVGIADFGDADALRVYHRPLPHAGPGEVRIRVHAAAVNPVDIVMRNGAFAEQWRANGPAPYVLGRDAAGVIDEIGSGAATSLSHGDRAITLVDVNGQRGAYAEHVVVPAESVVAAPESVDNAAAATLPLNGLTATQALDLLALQRGQTLAVTGAAGGFGGFVIQLAKHIGLRVVADAAPADRDLIVELGADMVLPRGPNLADLIREVIPDGVDGLADGAALGASVLPAIRTNGSLAAVRAFNAPTERVIRVRQVSSIAYLRENKKLDRLRSLVDAGILTLRVARRYQAEDAGLAHRALEAGGSRGRHVLRF